ncbi:hypothetical protein BXZ70DRAFT_906545 [Cristinia sonorae]|uniref:E3 ubiquitin-protein ligase n=1 Tax=Cristinia sonorae TaxID=1940300 RepID=A0A8K0UPT6_9AGAR|nr:hypothetical protein BXZ70DRAFT_906545 [Cristinia sonorae]
MSGLSSFFPSKLLGSMHPRDRAEAPFSRLRFSLDTMPGSRKYVFTPATRAEILSELYDAFWGNYAHLFLPNSNSSLPLHSTLSEVQSKTGINKDTAPVPGRPCGHIFKKGESCFRCKDCALDDSCVLCSRCFEAADHSEHNVSFFVAQQSGGCCDCGDVESWRTPIECPFHPSSSETSEYLAAFTAKTIQATPKITPRVIAGQEVPPVKNYPNRAAIPPELYESMSRTVAYAIDYLLDTLDYSPDEAIAPTNEAELRAQPTGDPMVMKDQYCVLIWNDDKHSFDEVIHLLCDSTGRTREEALEVAHKIDEQGREVVEMNANIIRLLDLGQTIAQIDLGVTIRRAYDTFREQVSAVIIEWLLDLTRSRVGSDLVTLREVIAAELLAPRKFSAPHIHPDVNKVLADIQDPSRLDWMFIYHTKLWKKPRLNLKEIYASILMLSHEHKLAVASHFANVYNRVIDAYLLVDREAETSIKYFALQLFTIPSVALYIVRQHMMVSRLLAVITSFFTNQIQDKRIIFPPHPDAEIDVDTFPFKSKRFMPVFSDLRYLCHNQPVQQLIAHNREFITQFSKTCQLFMCVNPNKRAASSHVEYETDAWISVFNVTLSLSRVIKVYGEAFANATVAELVSAITTVTHHILMVSVVDDDQRDVTRFPPVTFHDVEFGDVSYDLVEFDVLEGWVSFHHSLQWLLAELFKHVDLLSEESLRDVGLSSIREVCLRNASEQAIQTIIDYPLRVLAMVAQIRTGLWVRNGFAIRGQLIHYRDFMLRELCYDQDLFILQASLVILDPNTVIVSMLDRFQLTGFFSGATLHPNYDSAHLSGMVEELLYVLISILTETANATKMELSQVIRREVVHALAVGPCTFTDLTKRVAERLTDDVYFERVLKEVASFKPPDSITDSGMYELKDEAYDEINPFFYHYTRNKREEVEIVLRGRLQKLNGVDDPVIIPKPLNIQAGPFSTLPSVFESEVLLQIMFFGINNVLNITDDMGTAPPSAEAILDQTLYLIMQAIVEKPQVFSTLAAVKTFDDHCSLVSVLCTLEHHAKYSKSYKARVGWILSRIAEHQPVVVRSLRYVPDVADIDPEDAKKRAAKARQAAIMQQMKAQQASFAVNFEDFDDEDEDEDTESPEPPVSYGTCIVCQEELNESKPFGSLGFLQPSRLLRRYPDAQHYYMNDVLHAPESLDRAASSEPIPPFPPIQAARQLQKERENKPSPLPHFEGFSPAYTRFGLHSSICSHMMHLECFTVYSGSIRQRHRTQATRNHPESIPRKEYICPLCKSLGNVILPVAPPSKQTEVNTVPFPDWIRAAGINILKSKPDPLLDSLQFRNGTGEFVFWAAQDQGYQSFTRTQDRFDNMEVHKMVDTVMVVAKTISQQTRSLRERPEPEPGDRGAGMYLPDELVTYTIACLEVAQRGSGQPGSSIADTLAESQTRMIRGLVTCLTKLVALNFKGRPDDGRDAVRQAIIKRLLPEWSRTSFTSFAYPLLLRDPFTILVETAAVAPDMLRHVLILTYYACLARTVIGLLYVLNKTRNFQSAPVGERLYEDIFGDVRMFFMSVIRPSPIFEHAAEVAFQAYGDAKIEKLLYTFTLPFLRRAAILCRAVLPSAFPTLPASDDLCEYRRLLKMLDIPPLSDLPNQDTLQNALSGWCAHYGHSPAASQLNCGVTLDYPITYQLAKLPIILDSLFIDQEKNLTCPRCKTVPQDAAICLICGVTCCMQGFCCTEPGYQSRGECNMHTRE